MHDLTTIIQLCAATLAIAQVLLVLCARKKSMLQIVWAIFCGSLSMAMLKSAFGESIGPYQYALGLGACATCNMFWLVARALFRVERPIEAQHMAFAVLIATLLMLDQSVYLLSGGAGLISGRFAATIAGLEQLIRLLGSTVLVLAFWEGLQGWQATMPKSEKRLRVAFLLTYGGCVLACTVLTHPKLHAETAAIARALSALAIVIFASFAVRYRWAHPLKSLDSEQQLDATSELGAIEDTHANGIDRKIDSTQATAEEIICGEEIKACLHEQKLYLQPELKVADLAKALGVPDYKISRAITGALQRSNFNQLINEFRIAHAQCLLADQSKAHWPVLVVGIESGFASVGPFNRAFKQMVGMTPSAFRAAHCTSTSTGYPAR
jgi:AraC-like DNA-binding protein